MNKIKAYLHNKAIYTLMSKEKYNYAKIVIDEFKAKEQYTSFNNVMYFLEEVYNNG